MDDRGRRSRYHRLYADRPVPLSTHRLAGHARSRTTTVYVYWKHCDARSAYANRFQWKYHLSGQRMVQRERRATGAHADCWMRISRPLECTECHCAHRLRWGHQRSCACCNYPASFPPLGISYHCRFSLVHTHTTLDTLNFV